MSNIKIETVEESTPSLMPGVVHNPSLAMTSAQIATAQPAMPLPMSQQSQRQDIVKQESHSMPVPVPISTTTNQVSLPITNLKTSMAPPPSVVSPPVGGSMTAALSAPSHHVLTHTSAAPVSLAPVSSNADKAAVVAAARAVAMAPSVPRPVTTTPSMPLPRPDMTKSATSSKKTKGKSQVTVTMATAATATPASSGQGSQGENTGRWTAEEHRLFLEGLEQHGKGWKKIASLIKSRTVVQIRTHAQKYFQKLAKARQNGEDGDISMEGRGNIVGTAIPSVGPVGTMNGVPAPCHKRRRQATGTKRKAISSVVASAQAEGKRIAAETTTAPAHPPLPVVTPVLTPYVVPSPVNPHNPPPQPTHMSQHNMHRVSPPPIFNSVSASKAGVSGAALEDSLFRFLTPSANEPMPASSSPKSSQAPVPNNVNDVARQAGAPPIVVPSDNNHATNMQNTHMNTGIGGEGSPTGVNDINNFPTWIDCEPPSWFSKGSDVDELLNEADALDWLADSGDLDETYKPPPARPVMTQTMEPSLISICDTPQSPSSSGLASSLGNISAEQLPPPQKCDSVSNIPPLPSLFGSSNNIASAPVACQKVTTPNLSSASLFGSATEAINGTSDGLAVFESHFDEQAFVTALLENNESSNNILGALQ